MAKNLDTTTLKRLRELQLAKDLEMVRRKCKLLQMLDNRQPIQYQGLTPRVLLTMGNILTDRTQQGTGSGSL